MNKTAIEWTALDEAELRKMLTYKPASGKRVFIADMTDLFGEWVPEDLLNQLFSKVLEIRTDVTFQLLTKRAERMRNYLAWRWGEGRIPSRHIHLGVSVENQTTADERIPHLLRTPAAVRFLSCEPLIASVENLPGLVKGFCPVHDFDSGFCHGNCPHDQRISWVIVGCESRGSRAGRFADGYEAAARSIIRQCQDAGVPVFHKQMPVDGRVSHDPAEWEQDLRVREMPEGVTP